MASHGLTRMAGSASIGRAPSLSSRVKQSCMLLNFVFLASVRSRSENSRQMPIEASRTSGLFDLAQPAHELSRPAPGNAVGQQEVEVFLLGQSGQCRVLAHVIIL